MLGAGLALRLERGRDQARLRRPLARAHRLAAVWALSTAAASGVGVLSEMSALQSRPAIQVAPVVFVTQTVGAGGARAAAARRALQRHAARRHSAGDLAGVLIGGAAMLARSPLLLALMEGERVEPASGSTPSPSARARRRSARARAPRRPSRRTFDHHDVAGAQPAAEAAAAWRSGAARPSPASRRRCARAPAGPPTGRRAAAGSRSGAASPSARACERSVPRVRTQRSSVPRRALRAAARRPARAARRSVARGGHAARRRRTRRGCRGRRARRPAAAARRGGRARSGRRTGWSVLTRASGCTSRILAARARDLVGRHHPRADRRAAARAGWRAPPAAAASGGSGAPAAARPARPRRPRAAHRRLAPRMRSVVLSERGSGRGEARLHVLAQLVGVVGQPQQVERGHRAGVQARVADGQPVGDDRRAGGPRLQAGDAAGGVHEHVGGGQQLGHLVGEAVHVHARLVGERPRAACSASCSLRPARQTMLLTSGTLMNSRTAPAMSPTPQPPPETTTTRPSSGRPSARRAVERAARLQELGRDQRAHELHAARARRCARPSGIDSPYITRCMSMPGWAQKNRPVRSVIVATVGQLTSPVRRSRASTTVTAGYVETTTSGSCSAIVRASGREPKQAQQPAREHADGQHVLEQPVDERVGPREEAQLHAVAVLDDRPQHGAHRGEAVDDGDLGVLRRSSGSARPAPAPRRRGPRRRRRRGSGRGVAPPGPARGVCCGGGVA